jgi:hypothetical protein
MRFFDTGNPAGHRDFKASEFSASAAAAAAAAAPAWESPSGGLRDRAEAVTARHGPGLPRWSQYGHQDAIRVPQTEPDRVRVILAESLNSRGNLPFPSSGCWSVC